MRFLDNAPDSFYEELRSYFPSWYANVKEMDAIWHVTGEMLDQFKADLKAVAENLSIATYDTNTIRAIQDWAGASYNTEMSDEVIRTLFFLQIAGFGKCSRGKIIRLLHQLLDTEADVSLIDADLNRNQKLKIDIDISDTDNWDPDDIETLLERIVPAHLLRETHYMRKIAASMKLYYGMALQHLSDATITMADASDIGTILTDENNAPLVDENGIVLMDA